MQYGVFLTAIPNVSGERRIAILGRYLRDGLGPDVTARFDALFPIGQGWSAVLFVEADSQDAVTAAMAPAKSCFALEIYELESLTVHEATQEFNQCVMVTLPNPASHVITTRWPEPQSAPVIVFEAEFKPDGPCKALIFVESERHIDSLGALAATIPGTTLTSCCASSAKSWFAEMPDRASGHDASEQVVADQTPTDTLVAAVSGDLRNVGTKSFWFQSAPNTNNYPAVFVAQNEVIPTATWQASDRIYVWASQTETLTAYRQMISGYNEVSDTGYVDIPNDRPRPTASTPAIAGAVIDCDIDNKHQIFSLSNPLGKWLSDLLSTQTYDKPWPEDCYPAGSDPEKAYKYIVEQIGAAPKNGTLLNTDLFPNNYPTGADFSENAFNTVDEHLRHEVGYQQYAREWFDKNGIFAAINEGVVSARIVALQTAIQNMESSQDTEIEMILDSIFGIILGYVRVIPNVGSAIAAVLNTFWSLSNIGGSGSGSVIRQIIKDMDTAILNALQAFLNINEANLQWVMSDWGRMQTFAEKVIKGELSSDDLTVTVRRDSKGKIVSSDLDEGTVTQAAKAWRVATYQALMAIQSNMPQINMGVTTTAQYSGPSWMSGQPEEFTFSFPCVYTDFSNHNKNGYVNFYLSSSAPRAVFSDLFDPSGLNVDPASVFLGYNGWPRDVPIFTINNTTGHPALASAIDSIG